MTAWRTGSAAKTYEQRVAAVLPFTVLLVGPSPGRTPGWMVAEINLQDIAHSKIIADSAGHYARPEVLRLVVDARPKTGFTVLRGADDD